MNKSSHLDDLDVMLYAAMPYTKNKELDIYNNADPEIRLSDKDKQKIYRRVNRERNYAERHKQYRPGLEAIKRVAVVVLVVMAIGFASLLSVEAVRDAIWQVITQWYKESIFFTYVTDDDIDVPTEILEYKEPLIGEEFKRYEGIKNKYDFSVEYEKDDVLITYQQNLLDKYEVMLSNHDTVMSAVNVNGHDGQTTTYMISETEYKTILWNDGVYAYTISGNIDIDSLITYAESIS